jgi:hypothetical protein
MICLGIKMADKTCDDRIEKLERSRDFHKDQKEMFVEQAKTIFKENNYLKERNTQLINENEELKKQLDKPRTVSYDIIYNNIIGCEVPNSDEATPPLQKK